MSFGIPQDGGSHGSIYSKDWNASLSKLGWGVIIYQTLVKVNVNSVCCSQVWNHGRSIIWIWRRAEERSFGRGQIFKKDPVRDAWGGGIKGWSPQGFRGLEVGWENGSRLFQREYVKQTHQSTSLETLCSTYIASLAEPCLPSLLENPFLVATWGCTDDTPSFALRILGRKRSLGVRVGRRFGVLLGSSGGPGEVLGTLRISK